MLNAPSPAAQADRTLSFNMKLLSHHTLQGYGGLGEGMAMQLTRDGRRIMWLAHESAPKNFTGVDVTDPRNPKVVVQTDLPHMKLRSNSLDVVGDTLAVAYQTSTVGLKPAGVDLFDISVAENLAKDSQLLPLSAQDLDRGKNGRLLYEMLEAGPEVTEYVGLLPNSGILYLKKELDYEKVQTIEFGVQEGISSC